MIHVSHAVTTGESQLWTCATEKILCEAAHKIAEYTILAVSISVSNSFGVLVGKHIKISEMRMLAKHHTVFY